MVLELSIEDDSNDYSFYSDVAPKIGESVKFKDVEYRIVDIVHNIYPTIKYRDVENDSYTIVKVVMK